MRNKWLCLLLAAALTALTAGCSLARPEREAAQEDRCLFVCKESGGFRASCS